MTQPATFVWIDPEGSGRNVHAYFRRDFELEAVPDSAELHLFAADRYHLVVNGDFVNYGPVRGYPDRPEYDTYDLRPWLRKGPNCIAVHVAHWGVENFHTLPGPGGMVAWGSVRSGKGPAVDLGTGAGWKCTRATGYAPDALKYSFAQPCTHVFDAREDVPGWALPETDTEEWPDAVPLAEQGHWGELVPRTIPHLAQDETLPERLVAALPLVAEEVVVSLRVPGLNAGRERGADEGRVFACTYIYSPCDQEVPVHVFWGEHFLNGDALERRPAANGRNECEDMTLPLSKGWNFYFVSYGITYDTWDFQFGYPASAGLVLSPFQEMDSAQAFLTAGPFPSEEAERIGMPLRAPESLPTGLGSDWEPHRHDAPCANPAIDMVWAVTAAPHPMPEHQVTNIEVKDPHGTSLVFDMGRTTLGRVFVEFEGPEGAIVDMGTSESLRGGRPSILRRHGLFAAERHVAGGGGTERAETFEPRGFRYLEVKVTGATRPVTIRRVGVMQQVYPFEREGSFECSDPVLNKVWEIGWRALRMCAEDVYTDCPSRERGLYGGDFLVEMGVALAGSGDMRLTERCIHLFVDHQTDELPFIPGRVPAQRPERPGGSPGLADYALLVLLAWDWAVRREGGLRLAELHYAGFASLVEEYLKRRGPEGLVACGRPFIRHRKFDKGDFNTCINALVVASLDAMARTASMLHREGDVERYARAGNELRELTRNVFWDDARGVFSDGIRDGERLPGSEPTTNAWCVLFGVATAEQARRVAEYMADSLREPDACTNDRFMSPYSGFYCLGALYELGLESVAELLMRRDWGRMVRMDATTTWEHFDNEKSLCHAWGAAPTYYLSARALGVQLGFPGASDLGEVVVAPQSDTLSWARGVVPHKLGPVGVSWRVEGDRLMLDYTAAPGVRVRVAPRGRLAKLDLWVNGRPV